MIALVHPYKKAYMNIIDVLILGIMALIGLMLKYLHSIAQCTTCQYHRLTPSSVSIWIYYLQGLERAYYEFYEKKDYTILYKTAIFRQF